MADTFEDTSLFRRFKAQPSAPDPLADKVEMQRVFDDALAPLGVRAPGPKAKESDSDYLARLGEACAVFGPEERKSVNRYALPSAALAEFVREDLQIARQEADTPNYTLKEDVLTERKRPDASGRETSVFYSKSGPSVWMNAFKEPVQRFVSGGTNGILDADAPRSPVHNFMKSQTIPELREMQRQAAYADSAEGKIIAAYREAGLSAPDVKKLFSR